MNNIGQVFFDRTRSIARSVVKRRWLALGGMTAAAVVAAVGVSMVPERYEAKARVYVDTQTVLKPLMSGLTFQPDIDQQVRMLARTLVSRPNVEALTRIPELHMNTADERAREAYISRLTDQIKVVPTNSGNLFEISYRGTTPAVAQRVVEATVEMFATAGAGDKKRDSRDAGRFIEDQIRGYDARLTEAENRLKDYKLSKFGVTGVPSTDYFTRVSQLTEEVGKLRVELSAAERSRDAYRRELSADEPQLPATLARRVGGVSAVALPEVELRLEAQRKQLDDLLARFTEAHPDVISTRRIIGQLQAEATAQREAEEGALAKLGKGARAAASPVYQQLRLSLAETEAQVASLRAQLGAQQGRLDQVRALAGQVPQAEAELAQLNRDYDIVRKNYEAMIARRESASLGAKLDESAQLAEFRVIEPARVSPTPVFPSRVVLALGAVVACIGFGVALAVLADLLWPTYDDAAALRAESGRPVLGTISMLLTPARRHEHRMNLLRFGSAFVLLLSMQAVWVAWIAARSPSA